MAFLYVLKSQVDGRYYIGSTSNIQRRLKEHISGKTRTTKVWQATELVYSEEYPDIQEAKAREKKLKSYKSHKYIDYLIQSKLMGR
jgi:putative endonuclease